MEMDEMWCSASRYRDWNSVVSSFSASMIRGDERVPGRELTHRGYCHRTRGIAKFSILPRWGSVHVLHSNPLGNPKSDDSFHSPWSLYAMAALAKMPGQAKQQQARRADVDSLIMMIRVKCTG